MLVSSDNGDLYWTVYDAEECRLVRACVWANDETAQYCCYFQPFTLNAARDAALRVTYQAKRILIVPASKLIIINPVEDQDDQPADANAEQDMRRLLRQRETT